MSSYGNVKNQNDLEKRKRQHAETLQLMIENESIKQKKLADYKNPNKPPPVPPQYKTVDEITKDVMQQEKLLLDNVKDLGLDAQQSIGFLQLIKNKTGGVDNIVKLNRNYPSFKKSVLEGYNPKALTSQLLANIYDEFVTDLDTVTGLRNANPKATSFYNPVTGKPISNYLSVEQLVNTKKTITEIQDNPQLAIQPDGLAKIQSLLDKFIENSPNLKDLTYLNSLLPLEERQMNNLISTRVNRTNIPTSEQLGKTLYSIDAALSTSTDADEATDKLIPLLSVLYKQLSYIESEDTVIAMQEILKKIRSYAIDFKKVGVDLGADFDERAEAKVNIEEEYYPPEDVKKKKRKAGFDATGDKAKLIDTIIKNKIFKAFKGENAAGEELSYTDFLMTYAEGFPDILSEADIAELSTRLGQNSINNLKSFIKTYKASSPVEEEAPVLKPIPSVVVKAMLDQAIDEVLALNNIVGYRKKDRRLVFAREYKKIKFFVQRDDAEAEIRATVRAGRKYPANYFSTNYPITQEDEQILDTKNNPTIILQWDMLFKYGLRLPRTFEIIQDEQAKIKAEKAAAAKPPPAAPAAPAEGKYEGYPNLQTAREATATFLNEKISKLPKKECVFRILSLRDEFPPYKTFVTNTFGKLKSKKELEQASLKDLRQLISNTEADAVGLTKRIKDSGYNPTIRKDTALIETQGFGMREKLQKILKKEGKPRILGEGAKKPPDTIHIDINSHNGRDYKAGEGGFMHRKIKIGKGITAVERPRYEKFGKYTIHMPQLINESVLNVKYQSLGGVPSLKPTVITDNYRDFILNTLETGKVNNREFDSLANTEKEHFTKIAKGAGLIETLKIKNSPTIDHTEDIQRFNLLKGEFDAGNNNEKLIKELKGLVMKFISLGKLNKKLGLEFLMQLNLV